jgi:signal transduction histidine kinase
MSNAAAVLRRAMSAWLPSRPFVVNDLEYAPFGLIWLRGVTPARLALVAGLAAFFGAYRAGPTLETYARVHQFPVLWGANASRFFACAMPMLLLVAHAERFAVGQSTIRQITALGRAVFVGACVLAIANHWLLVALLGRYPPEWWARALNFVFHGIVWGGLVVAVAYFDRRARQAERLREEARLEEIRIERQIIEARLQALHAQIEPHFLFNTLATVKRLYETEPARGRDLIRSLRHYLAEAIPTGRMQSARLGEEISLALSYLDILKVRMGDRLQVRVDVPEEFTAAPVPPLMLGTLVENAVKHGIAPRSAGGLVTIGARLSGGALEISVADDGVGFRERSGQGVGLANTRARLQAQFGDCGGLDVARNAGGGTVATVRIPWNPVLPSRDAA